MGNDITTYRGRIIKKYPSVRLRVSVFEMKKFIDAQIDLGLSARDLIEHSGKPCQCCRGIDIIVFDKDDNAVKIPRGILSKKK